LAPGSNPHLIAEPISFRSLDLDIGRASSPFDLGFPDRIWWMLRQRVDVIETTLLAAGPGVEDEDFHRLIRPFPAAEFRHVVTVLGNVLFMLNQLVGRSCLKCTRTSRSRSTRSTTSPRGLSIHRSRLRDWRMDGSF